MNKSFSFPKNITRDCEVFEILSNDDHNNISTCAVVLPKPVPPPKPAPKTVPKPSPKPVPPPKPSPKPVPLPPKIRQSSWAIKSLNISDLWNEGIDGTGSKVCVLDTGINSNHSEIVVKEGVNFSAYSRYGVLDTDGHGTHTAGICCGRNKNADIGVAPNADLYVAKVFGDKGESDILTIKRAILWAINKEVDVISMSFGGDGDIPMEFASVISNAIKNNIIVIVAAGNSGPYRNTIEEPGNFTPCVTVGAVSSNFNIAGFSSRGSQIDLVAPGVDILSAYKGGTNTYARLSGTSMATPFIAGIAALFVQKAKKYGMKYNQSIFEKLIKETATDKGPIGFDLDYGAGLINPVKLLATIDIIASPSPHHPLLLNKE